jgi:hypothetical protein
VGETLEARLSETGETPRQLACRAAGPPAAEAPRVDRAAGAGRTQAEGETRGCKGPRGRRQLGPRDRLPGPVAGPAREEERVACRQTPEAAANPAHLAWGVAAWEGDLNHPAGRQK